MKKIFLVLLTLLLTGCSANVDVNIHKDYSVTEKISIFENKENIDVENSSYEQYVSDFKEFVIQSNADAKNGNKYTWRFSNDSDNKFNLKIRENIINKAVNNTSDTTIKMLLVILLIIIVISIFSYVFYKKYKKNRIEY